MDVSVLLTFSMFIILSTLGAVFSYILFRISELHSSATQHSETEDAIEMEVIDLKTLLAG